MVELGYKKESFETAAGAPHPKTHQILLSSMILFGIVWFLDSFIFRISTQLAAVVPWFIRLILFGVIFALAFLIIFKTRNTIYNDDEVKKIIKTGIFAYVRNPMYLSALLLFTALTLLTMSLISVVPIIIALILYTKIVKFEENDLERKFGEQYLEYKKKVPRWLPRLTPATFED